MYKINIFGAKTKKKKELNTRVAAKSTFKATLFKGINLTIFN